MAVNFGVPARQIDPAVLEEKDRRMFEQLEKLEKDPFTYSFVVTGIDSVMALSGTYWRYFPVEEAVDVITKVLIRTASRLPTVSAEGWSRYLRKAVLNRLAELAGKCEMCSLHKNRLPDRGAVFGDGNPDADLMVVSEGPGNFESRTGTPFCDNLVLRTSTCATHCRHFEACYIDPNNEDMFLKVATRPCKYEPYNADGSPVPTDILRFRVQKRNDLYTAGEHLTKALRKNGLLRQSYVKMLDMADELGTAKKEEGKTYAPNVFVTNAIRCRSMEKDAESGRMKDAAPSRDQVDACRPWLEMTMLLVDPKAVLAVGAPVLEALRAEKPKNFSIMREGSPDRKDSCILPLQNGKHAYVAVHPAAVMRKETPSERDAYWEKLAATVADAARTAREIAAEQKKLTKMASR